MRSVSQGRGQNNSGVNVTVRSRQAKSTPPRSSFGGKQKQASVAAAYATGQRSQAPSIVASRDSSRIVHRELILSVSGSAGFTPVTQFSLNPGLAATFPWLASQASSWEQYRFNKLRFCYYTRTGSNTPGSMLLVPDYDASDAAPSSEQIASSYEDVAEDAPWKDICCELRTSAMHSMGPKKFVRSGPLAANQDIKTYDVGSLFPCTTDGTAVPWGKLWVEYDVSLYVPQLPPAGFLAGANAQHFPAASNVPTSANLLGAAPVSNGSALVAVAGNVVTFATTGVFLLDYSSSATSDTQTAAPALGAGVSLVSTFGIGGTGRSLSGNGTATFNQQLVVDNLFVGGTVTFNNTVVGGTSAELLVTQLPSTLQ
jgi:hypothetical protein